MTTPTLHLTPTTDVALHHLRDQIVGLRERDRLAPVHLLLSSQAVADQVRQTLGDALNIHVHQVYGLGRAVLQASRTPVYELHDTAIRRLVHHLLRQMADAGELTSFLPVWEKPGFTDAMLAWLREMKSQGIDPARVSDHARRSGLDRDRQLAALYQRYQAFLQQSQTSDADGLLWLAAESLEAERDLFRHPGPLFVLGFDQFTPVQLRILASLAERYQQTSVYLTWDPHRGHDSLALTRLVETRRQLIQALTPVEIVLDTPAAEEVPAPLRHLRRTLFEPLADEARAQPGQAIRLVEAPSREEEVRWAVRAIKQLLLDGVDHGAIALAAPNPAPYGRLVETVAAEYGVPMAVEEHLATSPAVDALLAVVGLAPDFPWRETFRVLRSPYIRQSWLTPAQIDRLDQLTRERPVVAGRDQWRFALRPLSLDADEADDDEDRSAPPLVATLPAEELAALEAGLEAFFDHCTPPPTGDHRAYVLWIQETILGIFQDDSATQPEEETPLAPTLDLLGRCAQGLHPERDLRAMQRVMRALRQLVTAADLLPDDGAPLAWPLFHHDLVNILPAVAVEPDPRVEAVAFSSLEAYRALPVDHLFVLGLGEGEFPSPPPPDPLYTVRERAAHPLPLRRYVDGDDACLWWQVTGNCRRRLTLLRPWADENGAPWPASPYWTEVASRFVDPPVHHIPAAAAMTLTDAASHNELLTALAAVNAARAPASLATVWEQAQAAGRLIQQRNSWQPPGPYEGVIRAADLRRELAARFGPDHVWSASRLNRYGACPYGFFAGQVLKLEARPDPEEGIDPARRGSILHAILERLYGSLAADGIAPIADRTDDVLARLDEACTAVFQDAPRRYGFRPSPLWRYEQAEFRRLLVTLVREECEKNGSTPAYLPYRQEVGFGVGGTPPVRINAASGDGFRLRGFIDRVDRRADGRLRIVDYKSGSGTYSVNDVRKGLALQTALYALAAESLLAAPVDESFYLHIPTREKSGKLKFAGSVAESEEVQAAVAAASGFITHIRNGLFPSAPAKPQGATLACASWCDLASVCRVTRRSITQGRRLLERE